MKIICVDDEALVLDLTVNMCKALPQVDACIGCLSAREALAAQRRSPADIVLLDINMPDMSGIELAKEIRAINPSTKIIFLTGYGEYAVDAFKIHASGYLLKPVSEESLIAEINYCLSNDIISSAKRVDVHTFGEFEIFSYGERVLFERSRSKELLAYLIDRRGNAVPRANIFSALWEDRAYDRPMQKQLDVIIRSMRSTLKKYNISEIFELNKGELRIIPDRICCDYYKFLDGDVTAINSFFGEYMNSYTWAKTTEAYLDQMYRNHSGGVTPSKAPTA